MSTKYKFDIYNFHTVEHMEFPRFKLTMTPGIGGSWYAYSIEWIEQPITEQENNLMREAVHAFVEEAERQLGDDE